MEEVEEEAKKLLDENGLHDWIFRKSTQLKKILGICRYGKKVIEINYNYCKVASKEEILKTVKHEIAHAIAGFTARHGKVWKNVCTKLGLKDQQRLAPESDSVNDFLIIYSKYVKRCKHCDKERAYFRKPKHVFVCEECKAIHYPDIALYKKVLKLSKKEML